MDVGGSEIESSLFREFVWNSRGKSPLVGERDGFSVICVGGNGVCFAVGSRLFDVVSWAPWLAVHGESVEQRLASVWSAILKVTNVLQVDRHRRDVELEVEVDRREVCPPQHLEEHEALESVGGW